MKVTFEEIFEVRKQIMRISEEKCSRHETAWWPKVMQWNYGQHSGGSYGNRNMEEGR
jgi:hypothetical protein